MDAAEPPGIVYESSPVPVDRNGAESPHREALEVRPVPVSPPEELTETDDEHPKLELGVGTFLLAGALPVGFIGVTPFLIADMGSDVFLRPSIALGKPFSGSTSSTWAAARLDTCARITGLYARGQGMAFDACGGADVGFSYIGQGTDPGSPPASVTQPYVAIGPSLDLRAEVGRLVVSLRAAAAFNVARQTFDDVTGVPVDGGPVSLRIELDFSWRLPDHRAVRAEEGHSAASL